MKNVQREINYMPSKTGTELTVKINGFFSSMIFKLHTFIVLNLIN